MTRRPCPLPRPSARPHVPTAKELREQQQHSHFKVRKWDSEPTGELTLEPGGVVDPSSTGAIDVLIERAVAEIVTRLDDEKQKREDREAAQKVEREKER